MLSKHHFPIKGTIPPWRNNSILVWCKKMYWVSQVCLIVPESRWNYWDLSKEDKSLRGFPSIGWDLLGIKSHNNFNKLKHRYKNLWVQKCNWLLLGAITAPIHYSENWQRKESSLYSAFPIQTAFRDYHWWTRESSS